MCVVVIAAEVLVARGERAGSVVASVVIVVEAAKIVEGEGVVMVGEEEAAVEVVRGGDVIFQQARQVVAAVYLAKQ